MGSPGKLGSNVCFAGEIRKKKVIEFKVCAKLLCILLYIHYVPEGPENR